MKAMNGIESGIGQAATRSRNSIIRLFDYSIISRKGFTLVEMLVVIGIIAILIAASFGSYTVFVKKAARTRCVELVSNVHSALVGMMLTENAWPRPVLAGPGAPGDGKLDENVGAVFAKRNAMSLTFKAGTDGRVTLTGNDRYGIVTPWAYETLKHNKNAGKSTPVPSGGTVEKHVLHYAIDDDLDGFTEISSAELGNLKVRASACVWCCGADGVISPYAQAGSRSDDVYSWTADQVVK